MLTDEQKAELEEIARAFKAGEISAGEMADRVVAVTMGKPPKK